MEVVVQGRQQSHDNRWLRPFVGFSEIIGRSTDGIQSVVPVAQ